ncbi:MAG: branched-chain amino acid ABC transporter permease [Paracoccaceae bacterium]|nr:branched-chain amino acid ABC transporter permease [Paracoccaceae bacterium]
MTGYMSGVLAILGINIIFAYSIYITAATGQLNLGGAGFQAIGAYASAILSNEMGFPIGLTLIFASIFGGLISFLIAFPILRTKGVYMVLATFAIAEIVAGVILNSDYLGGPTGIVVNDYIETELILIVAVTVVLFGFYLMSTRIGLAMRAVHDDDAVANLMGVNTRAIQIGAFTLGGAIAGLSGGLYALYFGFVEAQYFNANISIFVLLFVLIGGTQTAWGPLIGASFFTLIPEALRIGDDWRFFIFGIIIVGMMIVRPEGIVTRDALDRVWFKILGKTNV